MVARVSDKNQNYNNVTKLLVKPSFYYDGFKLTDDMIEQLESFTLDTEDDSYTVYLDDGSLVVY